jgi:hypothetical protein
MAPPKNVTISHQMADAVLAMRTATGCDTRDALRALLVLVAENAPDDQTARIESLEYLLRHQPDRAV